MEQQQKVTSTYSEDEIEQNIASFPIEGYLNTRVLVKEIQKEKQKISLLEKEKEVILSESELLRETISKCQENNRMLYEQFKRSNEICDSHKKNNDVLEKHIFELVQALNIESQKECNDKKLYDQVCSSYQAKWQEYFAMYSKHPLFPQYEDAKRRHIEMKEYLKSSESQLRQMQADVFRMKCERSRKNSEENKFFPMQNFVVWIARLRQDTTLVEKEIKETSRDCTELRAKLKLLRSEMQKKKSFLESNKRLSDLLQRTDNVHLEQGRNADSRNLQHFSPPPPPLISQPRMTSSGHKFTFFIPKLTSVTSVSNGIFSSQQAETNTRGLSVSPGQTDRQAESSSNFRRGASPAAKILTPLERMTQKVTAVTGISSRETSVLRAPVYTPSQDSKTATSVLKKSIGDISSTKDNAGSKIENNCITNLKSSDNFALTISSSNNSERMTYPLNSQENRSSDIKNESKISPYFLGTPKLAANVGTPCSSSSASNQDSPSSIVWKPNRESTVDPTLFCSSKTNTSAVTTLSSRAFSPFDIKKHMETLEEMKRSPGFDYKSRSMYTVEGGNDKAVDNTSQNSSTSEKHEIMESEMFCGSLFQTGATNEKHELRIRENTTPSPRVGQESTFSVEKLCDSPMATASTEKSLFSFDTAAETRPTQPSVFSLFGDDDTEISTATTTSSNFLFNFRPSQEEKTESSSFKFLF